MKENKKNLHFEQSGGESEDAVTACRFYCLGDRHTFPDLTPEVRQRMNTCTAIADMCKDANTKIPIASEKLKENLKAMYVDEGNLHDFIETVTQGREYYKPVLVALEKHTKDCADRGGMFGELKTYSNLVKKNPITLKVCGSMDEQTALIHETGLDPRRVVVGGPNIIIGLPAAFLDPGSDIQATDFLEGVYNFDMETLKKYGLPDNQLWEARRVGGYYHYHLKVGNAGVEQDDLKFHLDTKKGFYPTDGFRTTDATLGYDITKVGYGTPVDRNRIKQLIVGNNQKNEKINHKHTAQEESIKLLISKEEGDLLQVLTLIEALKKGTITPKKGPKNVVITTTDHVVLTQIMTFLIENKEVIDKNEYIVEVVYTGSMLDKKPGCITLTVYSNVQPSDDQKYLKALNGYLSAMKSHILSQKFLLNKATYDHGNVIYEDPSSRVNPSRGFAKRVEQCTQILTAKADYLDGLNLEIIADIETVKREAEEKKGADPDPHLLADINTKIRDFKNKYEIGVYISLEKNGVKKKLYHIVDENMRLDILEKKHGPSILTQSGGMKLIKQKGGAAKAFVEENFKYGYKEQEGTPTEVADVYDNREDKLEDELTEALKYVTGPHTKYVILDISDNFEDAGGDGEDFPELSTKVELFTTVDPAYLIMIKDNFVKNGVSASSGSAFSIHSAHKAIAQEINKSIKTESSQYGYDLHDDLLDPKRTINEEEIVRLLALEEERDRLLALEEENFSVGAKMEGLSPQDASGTLGNGSTNSDNPEGNAKAMNFDEPAGKTTPPKTPSTAFPPPIVNSENSVEPKRVPPSSRKMPPSPRKMPPSLGKMPRVRNKPGRFNPYKMQHSQLPLIEAHASGGARKSMKKRRNKKDSKKKKQMSGGKIKKRVIKLLKSQKKRRTLSRKLRRKYKRS